MTGAFEYGPPVGGEAARLAAGVGALIAAERKARGWSKAELRRRAGVDLGRVELGRSRPSWPGLCRVAAALHPDDRPAAQALALRLAEAAGPSLAGSPWLPVGVSRELVVLVLVRSARAVGLDLDDDTVRLVVGEQLRLAAGEAASGQRAIGAAPEGEVLS
ncbi:helix-turn-helix transcriptional regulator [Micromonospora sp. 4G57]|uniref:Helix-turn-helix transcriptional regulator n=1 Tax=Micromonospora sicca TaxID=2202420 RepID=A0ABU5JAQ9_9ACTN|nr:MULTISPECIES: helix-turn-helix transcriptional regulator [unclassified Micromonospora]MDZ5443798.1 helix-turn-helix transcriptional regulator [Micromonospora sp. 4G57]MDZ5489684.1 helix-turn-helix transcriptional regulator [Micromonospora sp. 4G53]